MPVINVLSESTACRIAAGEVVERPVSVVKELVENALDAGSDSVVITVGDTGSDLIMVVDNGCGISQEDIPLAFQRHATSKISDAGDLEKINTLGFRGEALPGIAAVSDMIMKTRMHGSNEGCYMRVRGGQVLENGPAGCPAGTAVTVRDLFFNTPARRKHLKSKSTEIGLISELVYKMALIRPGVRFTLRIREREVFRSPGTGDLLDTVGAVYGVQSAALVVPVYAAHGDMSLAGCVGKPSLSRSTRQHVTVSVNGRLVRSRAINQALEDACRGLLTVGRHPLAVLHLQLPLDSIDVNIHPAKTEIKMADEDRVAQLVAGAVRAALREANLIPGGVSVPRGKHVYPPAAQPYTLSFTPPGDGPGPEYPPLEQVAPPAVMQEPGPETQGPDSTPSGLAAGAPRDTEQPGPVISLPVPREGGLPDPGGEVVPGGVRGPETEPATAPEAERFTAAARAEDGGGVFPELQVVGQLLNLYIVCQGKDGVYLIDQHAAHERLLFNEFYQRLTDRKPEIQYLLTPISLNLRRHEKELLGEHGEALAALGFMLEDFGRDSLLLRGIPAECSPGEGERLIVDLVETILTQGKTGATGIEFALSALLACKAAVKAGERLTFASMQSLVDQLAGCREPFTCPHGRPTMVTITRRQLDAMFKRI